MNYNFFIYGFCGWNVEILWTGFCGLIRGDLNMVGHSSLWMFLIYGVGGLIFENVYKKIKNRSWYERGLIWTYLIFIIEFISGLILNLIGVSAWKYTGIFSVAGLIRLDYAPLWFFVGLMFEKIYCFLIRFKKVDKKPSLD